MNEAAERDKGAANLINEWIEKGFVKPDSNGQPNIVGNAEDQENGNMFTY